MPVQWLTIYSNGRRLQSSSTFRVFLIHRLIPAIDLNSIQVESQHDFFSRVINSIKVGKKGQ